MKKKLLALLAILLALMLLASLVNSAGATTGGGSGGGTGGGAGGSSGGSSGDSSATYSWIDPQTGFDIFDYPNLLSLSEGDDRLIHSEEGMLDDRAILHADGSIDLPESVESLNCFTVNIGSYEFQTNHKYYFYYAYQIDGEYERCGLGYESMTDGKYDVDFSVEGNGEAYEAGCWEPHSYEATNVYVTLNVKQGLDGTMNSANSGRFYLRVIAVPR